jgi:2-polyprenyl-6-methoxyphenol hydroxylase-like FAD-dependent oxidoreductase
VKTWFQAFAFKCNLCRYSLGQGCNAALETAQYLAAALESDPTNQAAAMDSFESVRWGLYKLRIQLTHRLKARLVSTLEPMNRKTGFKV